MKTSDLKRDLSLLPLSGREVLVVEDDSDTREILKFVLEQNGAKVVAVDGVEPALEAFQADNPDTIVADIGMPGYNGYALIAKIRELERETSRRTRCIAVTAFSTPKDRTATLNAGFDAYLAKPFRPAELVKTLSE